jgi:hypothetical protein
LSFLFWSLFCLSFFLRQGGVSFPALRFPPPIKLTAMI